MKYLTIFLMLFSLTANAEISTAGLNKEEIAQLQLNVAQMKLEKQVEANTPEVVSMLSNLKMTPEELNNLGTYGTQLGKVLTGFVKEIGITANEFLQTPWGGVAVVLVAWHFFASDIALVMMSLGVLILFFLYWNKLVAPSLYTYVNINSTDGKYDDKESENVKPLKVKAVKLRKVINKEMLEKTPGVLAIVGFIVFIIIEIIIMANIG